MPRVLLVLLAALALAACGGEESSPGPATGASSEAGISLAGQTLDGESLSLEEFRGKPLFVNVWASW
jgi:hypothetical protein